MKWIMSDFPVRNENGGLNTIRSFSCSNCHYVVQAIHSKCPGCGEEADKGTDFVITWGKWNSNPLGDSKRQEKACGGCPMMSQDEYITKAQAKEAILSWARVITKPHLLVADDAQCAIDAIPPTTMTPEKFKKEMEVIASRTIEDGYDQEDRHRAADYLMIQVLEELGYKDGCDVFEKMPKWYA